MTSEPAPFTVEDCYMRLKVPKNKYVDLSVEIIMSHVMHGIFYLVSTTVNTDGLCNW